MRIYLVQHAEAKLEEQDPDRSLTDLGRQHAESVAAVAAALDVRVTQIRHSGKARTRQTAEIIGKIVAPQEGVVAASGLAPLDSVVPIAEELERASQPVMLVGHLPFMGRLAGYLLTGDADQDVIDFTNAGIVCLEKVGQRWQTVWIITPEIADAKR